MLDPKNILRKEDILNNKTEPSILEKIIKTGIVPPDIKYNPVNDKKELVQTFLDFYKFCYIFA